MSKKISIPILASILSIPAVLAQAAVPTAASATAPLELLGNFLKTNFGWLFVDFNNYANAEFWLRVMLWIVLFAVFYAVLMGIVPVLKDRKRISTIVSLVMSLISVVFIPKSFLFAIGRGYGFAVAFLLMAIPIGATIYLLYVAFPTGTHDKNGNERPVSSRRVNHVIKAILYYLLFTLFGNFISAATTSGGDIIFSRDIINNVAAFGGFAESFTIFMLFYHLIAAIFMKGISTGDTDQEEGWLMKMLKEGAKNTVNPAEKKKKEKEPVDLTNIRQRIANFSAVVQSFENDVEDFASEIKDYASTPENEREDAFESLLKSADDLKGSGGKVEVQAADVLGDPNYKDLEERDFVQLTLILRRYRVALGIIIDGIRTVGEVGE